MYRDPESDQRNLDVSPQETFRGGCACGAIRFEFHGKPKATFTCHCRSCQRASGSAFMTAVIVPFANFRFTRGQPKYFTTMGDSGGTVHRAFCGDCGSPVGGKVSAHFKHIIITLGCLDDPTLFHPAGDIFTATSLPWVTLSDRRIQYTGMPPVNDLALLSDAPL